MISTGIDSIKGLAVTATFSRLEDRTTVDRHVFIDVFYVLDLYHSWNWAQGGLISESTTTT